MKLREIKQHNLTAILSIGSLFLVDSFSYFIAYHVTDSVVSAHGYMPFPWRSYIIIIVIIYLLKNYNPSPRISRSKDAKNIIKSIYALGIIYTFGKILFKDISIDQAQYNLLFLHLFLIIDIPLRFTLRTIQRLFLKHGFGGRSTILLGVSQDAQKVASEILCNPTLGFNLQGYFNQSESTDMNHYCPYIGSIEDVYVYVKKYNIHEMIIVLDNHEHDKLLEIIGRYEMLDICIKIIPDMYEAISGQVRIDMLQGIPLMDINSDIMTEFQSLLKRIMDIIFSLIVIIFLFPLSFVTMILIYYTSPGGILYKQIRMGKNGVNFKLYKFRSMYENSEINTGPVWSYKGDERVTNIGKMMRKFHFDEIPQFVNVIMGQMSIVGPRPERPEIVKELIKEIPYYTHRMKVKPGITGWAQIRGTYDSNIKDVYIKLKNDFFYIENISLFFDIKILLLTFWRIINGKGQ